MNVKFPIGELKVPEQVTLKDINESLEKIKDYTSRLRDTVDGLSDVELNKTYRDDSWNVRELVHHIADSQLNMYQRLKLALTDENPVEIGRASCRERVYILVVTIFIYNKYSVIT